MSRTFANFPPPKCLLLGWFLLGNWVCIPPQVRYFMGQGTLSYLWNANFRAITWYTFWSSSPNRHWLTNTSPCEEYAHVSQRHVSDHLTPDCLCGYCIILSFLCSLSPQVWLVWMVNLHAWRWIQLLPISYAYHFESYYNLPTSSKFTNFSCLTSLFHGRRLLSCLPGGRDSGAGAEAPSRGGRHRRRGGGVQDHHGGGDEDPAAIRRLRGAASRTRGGTPGPRDVTCNVAGQWVKNDVKKQWKHVKTNENPNAAHTSELKLVMSSSPVVKSSYCDIFVTLQRIRCYSMPPASPSDFCL